MSGIYYVPPVERLFLLGITPQHAPCVVRYINGWTRKEIAADLGITPHMVNNRLNIVRSSTGASSAVQLLRIINGLEGKRAA